MRQLTLQNRPGSRILVGWRLSWVLEFWHLTEAHIPSTISKQVQLNNLRGAVRATMILIMQGKGGPELGQD